MISVQMRSSFEGIVFKARVSFDAIDLQECLVLTTKQDEDTMPRTKMSDETSGRVPRNMEIGIWLEDSLSLNELLEGLEQFCKVKQVRDPELYMERMLHVSSGRVEPLLMMLHHSGGRASASSKAQLEEVMTTDMMRFTSGRRPYESDSD